MVQYIVNFTDPERTAFNVNSFTSDGPVAPNTLQLNSSAVKASTGLLLYGKGHANYGERIQENLINLMENFSGSTEPTFPISGQTWFARITYALINAGSPGGASSFFRWEDDSSLANGGSWVTLTSIATNPTTADEVKVGGNQPTTIVDGSFWYDTTGSPEARELKLGVNNASSNLTATFLVRELEDLTGVVSSTDLTTEAYLPQKQLKVYDGNKWKNSGSVYASDIAPQRPSEGDMWFNTGQNDVGSPQFGSPALGGSPKDQGPQNQLFIWESGAWRATGYVDTGGDVMTGTLQFGLPTSSLFIWENGGVATAGSDIRFVNGGVLSSNDNIHILIDNDSSDAGAGNNFFRVAHGRGQSSALAGNIGSPQRPLFEVLNDGIIRSALALGSPEGSVYQTLIIASDSNALTNRRYVDDVTASLAGLADRVTANEDNIGLLSGSPPTGSPIEAKVNRVGDTMTGQLLFTEDLVGMGSPLPTVYVPTAGSPFQGSPRARIDAVRDFPAIDALGHSIINLGGPPVGLLHAANKEYVDDQITSLTGSPSLIPDRYVNTITLDWNLTKLFTLTQTGGVLDLTASLIHSHNTATSTHTIDTSYLRDLFQEAQFGSPLFENQLGSPIGSPQPGAGSPFTGSPVFRVFKTPLTITQEIINEVALGDLNCRADTLEQPTEREVFVTPGAGSPGGSPVLNLTSLMFTEDSYVAGTNRLQVFVNGVKQYANERAFQRISFAPDIEISPSAQTELSNDGTVFTLEVSVDGGGSIQLSAPGNTLQIFQDIIDEINAQITGATAVWSKRDTAIVVYSDTTGTNSAINISESPGSPTLNILQVLATTTVGTIGSPAFGSPILGSPKNLGSPVIFAYALGDISPVAGGPVSTIVQDLAYTEVRNHTLSIATARYGQVSQSIIFNASLNPGDVIELLANPAFFIGAPSGGSA